MREIIDFHIHPFINPKNNFCFYENTVHNTEFFFEDLRNAGITGVCGSVIRRVGDIEDFEIIKAFNNEALELRERYEGYYEPGIHIHPKFVKESIAELERMHNAGVKLVGELVPYMMGWDSYFNDNINKIYSVIDELNMVVSFHTKYEETIAPAVEKFKDITFVAAHPGDKEQFFRHIERLKKYKNYYLDLSGTGIFRYGLIGYGVRKVGSEKFLFGTDYPICNPSMYVNAVLYEKLKVEDYNNILSGNAKRILNIQVQM